MRARAMSVLVALMLVPSVATADVGTPLVWGTAFHLLLGNLLVGALEGAILARLFSLKLRRCIGLLIVANYVSSWVGLWAIDKLARWLDPDLYHGLQAAFGLIATTYVLTLVLEWPFVAIAVGGTPGWLRRSVQGSLIAQTASYVLIFGAYALVSATSLYTRFSVVPREQLSLPGGVQVFYLGAQDGDVYRLVDRSAPTRVLAWHSVHESYDPHPDSLRFDQEPDDSLAWDLVAVRAERGQAGSTVVAVAGVVRSPRDSVWNSVQPGGPFRVPAIGAALESPWQFRTSPWPSAGMWGRNRTRGEPLRLAFGTPVLGWSIWRAIHLPGDRILFVLGRDQICLVDLPTRRVALLARGRGMVASIARE